MKNIFYSSNVDALLHPNNTRCKFNTIINIHSLDYLPNENIEVAVKSITFENTRIQLLQSDQILGIRSNICEPVIRNAVHDRIISLLHIQKTDNGVLHVDFKNPTYFSTRKELLSRASFELIDIENNKLPNFAGGSPTFIQVVIRKEKIRMKPPFTIFLDSSCEVSRGLYPKNSNMEFTIKLPERMNFKRNWNLALKSLFISNTMENICDDNFFFKYYKYGQAHSSNSNQIIKNGRYKTIHKIIEEIQSMFDKSKINLKIVSINQKVKIYYTRRKKVNRQLYLSPYLAVLLGYNGEIGGGQYLSFSQLKEYIAPHDYRINILTPKNLIVCCDVVDDTIFGGEYVKLIRFVTHNISNTSNILSYEFLQNEYVGLQVKNFTSIKIRIANVRGQTIKCDPLIPTRLQIEFVNV